MSSLPENQKLKKMYRKKDQILGRQPFPALGFPARRARRAVLRIQRLFGENLEPERHCAGDKAGSRVNWSFFREKVHSRNLKPKKSDIIKPGQKISKTTSYTKKNHDKIKNKMFVPATTTIRIRSSGWRRCCPHSARSSRGTSSNLSLARRGENSKYTVLHTLSFENCGKMSDESSLFLCSTV